MNELIAYLRQNVILDFQGDLSIEKVRELLKGDEGREARQLLSKLNAEGSIDEMMLVLADCLLETVQQALTDAAVREQIRMYAES